MIGRKIKTAIANPKVVLIKFLYFMSPLLGDKLYLKLLFPLKVGYRLNLENPKSYNEKIQWLKLNYRDEQLPKMVDKFEYKSIVKNLVGEDYIVKTYGIWDSVDDIDLSLLPDQFVLKTTHDQGGIVICKEKSMFDFQQAKKILNKHLKRKFYYLFREWPYKNLAPRVMAEEFLVDESGTDLKDYKFYCFHGEPKIMYIASGRNDVCSLDFYDMDFNYIDIRRPKYRQAGDVRAKPESWEAMKELARMMSKDQPHVRIDFYNIDGKILFGEYTLFQGGGLMPFFPQEWDYRMGSWIDLDSL